nr:hypothetical protein GTC16762_18710 [Pigmentibacter ruber]
MKEENESKYLRYYLKINNKNMDKYLEKDKKYILLISVRNKYYES